MSSDPKKTLRDAWEAIAPQLGSPVVEPLTNYIVDHGHSVTSPDMRIGWHPIFPLMHHYTGNDVGGGGYTGNHYRGDHLSLPMVDENGDISVIDISFHKGDTHFDVVTWPDAPEGTMSALRVLFFTAETR